VIGLGQGRSRRGGLVIAVSLLVALILDVVPLPGWAEPFRPEWVTMVVIYWCMAVPERVGIGIAWITGLVLDFTVNSLMGQNALALSVVAFLALVFHLRVRMYPLWQQSLVVMALVAAGIAINVWVRGIIGEYHADWRHWSPALSSMLLWPWLFVILRDLRRFARLT
jgi:rod shape-determining protein MreD